MSALDTMLLVLVIILVLTVLALVFVLWWNSQHKSNFYERAMRAEEEARIAKTGLADYKATALTRLGVIEGEIQSMKRYLGGKDAKDQQQQKGQEQRDQQRQLPHAS